MALLKGRNKPYSMALLASRPVNNILGWPLEPAKLVTAFFFSFLHFFKSGFSVGGKTFQQQKAHVVNTVKCFQNLSGRCHLVKGHIVHGEDRPFFYWRKICQKEKFKNSK
jgi:hypothetical protein